MRTIFLLLAFLVVGQADVNLRSVQRNLTASSYTYDITSHRFYGYTAWNNDNVDTTLACSGNSYCRNSDSILCIPCVNSQGPIPVGTYTLGPMVTSGACVSSYALTLTSTVNCARSNLWITCGSCSSYSATTGNIIIQDANIRSTLQSGATLTVIY